MTAQTVGAGIGVVLISLGFLVIHYSRSALADRRARRTKVEAADLAKTRAFLAACKVELEPWQERAIESLHGFPRNRLRTILSTPRQHPERAQHLLSTPEWDALQREIDESVTEARR